jgi:hypothetical protein
MNQDSNAIKALKAGYKLTYSTFADHEFIYAKNGRVFDECDIDLGTIEQFQEEESYEWTIKY